jgi:hypothetical protein
MPLWFFSMVQTTKPDPLERLINVAVDNPQVALFVISLLVFYFVTRGWTSELRESRKMLNSAQAALNDSRKAGDDQETKALDMAMLAINKMDRVAEALDNFADAQRSSSTKYFESAEKTANAQIESTTMLVNRIAEMEKARAEDAIYGNEHLMRQVNTQLMQSQEVIGKTVGEIIAEARVMHEATRRSVTEAVTNNNEILMAALRSTPPVQPPAGED